MMRIAFVGAGPVAVAAMEALIHAHHAADLSAPLHATVFDPSPHAWCGPNFAPDVDEAITNTPVADMSLRWWEPTHCSAWFAEHGHAAFTEHDFPPRAIFGRYLQQTAQEAAKRFDSFARVRDRVTRVIPSDDRVRLQTPTTSQEFDYAVLCVGSAQGSVDPYGLRGQAQYVAPPYPLTRTLQNVAADEHVGVIGTGLTAVDVALSLASNGHRGPISLMSRRGWLPAVRRPGIAYRPRHFTVERLEQLAATSGTLSLPDFIALGRDELDAARASPTAVLSELFAQDHGLARLRRQLAVIDDGDVTWQVMFQLELTAFQDAWQLLNDDDKAVVRNLVGHQAANLCCAMPEHRAARMLELADAGQLRVVRRLRSVRPQPDGSFVATADSAHQLRFSTVISAIAGEDGTPRLAVPIVDDLIQSGGARPHRLGGLDVERTTHRLVAADGCPQPRLYALGGLIRGASYVFDGYVMTVPRTRRVADAVVTHFTNDVNIGGLMSHQSAVVDNEQAGLFLLDQAMSFCYPGALRAAASSGVADQLVDGPKSARELAEGTEMDPQKLHRVLRLLATRGVFREDDDGHFELTHAAEPLLSDAPLSVRKGVMMLTSKALWMSVGELGHTLDGSKPPFEELFGSKIWDYWGQDLPEAEEFHAGMLSMSDPEIQSPVRSYDFPDSGTVVDVGGGHGGLLRLVLESNPQLHGILYDQDHVLANHTLGELGDDSRWQAVSGDFFEAAPAGDVYTLKYITHDWDDERAALILSNCRKAMKRDGRVLVFDTVIPTDNEPHFGKLMDIVVMGIYPGRERTEEDFRQLFEDAGLRLTRVIDTDSYISIVEGVPA